MTKTRAHKDRVAVLKEMQQGSIYPSSITTGASKGFMPYGVSSASKDFITTKEHASVFSKKSALIRDYFADIEVNSGNLSYHLLTLLSEELEENTKNYLPGLKECTNSKEVFSILDKMMYGEKDSSSKELINAIIEIELKNKATLDFYRNTAKKQNPVMGVLEQSMNDVKYVEKLYLGDKAIFEGEHTEKTSLALLNYVLKNPRETEENSHTETSETKKIRKHFLDGTEEDIHRSLDNSKVRKTIADIQKQIDIKKLQTHHKNASKLARKVVIASFQDQGTPSLEEIVYQEDAAGNGINDRNIEINRGKLRQALTKGLQALESDEISQDLEDEILGRISDKFSGKDSAFKKAIVSIDLKYANSQEKHVPADARIEEIFLKMLEDEIYNAKIKQNGGIDYFKKLGGKVSQGSAVIDVISNTITDKYAPIGTLEKGKIEKDALGLHNISTLFDKIEKGSVSKDEARYILNNETPILNTRQKTALSSNLNKLFEKKKLKLSTSDIETVRKDTGDYLMQGKAMDYFNKRYPNRAIDKALGKIGIFSKSAATLMGCLKKAENPTISHHSSASETSQCLESAKKEIEQNINEYQSALSNNLLALGGMNMFILLFLSFERMHELEIQETILEANIEREKGLSFLSESLDEVEEEYRGKAVISNGNGIEGSVVDKENYGEHLFRSANAKHDYHKKFNPYLDYKGESLLDKVSNTSSKEAGTGEIVLALGKILSSNSNLRNNFLSNIEEESRRNKEAFDSKSINLINDIMDPNKAKDKYENIDEMIELLTISKTNGYTDVYSLKSNLETLKGEFNKDVRTHANTLKTEKEKLEVLEERATQAQENGTPEERDDINRELYKTKANLIDVEKMSGMMVQRTNKLKSLEVSIDVSIDNAEDFIKAKEPDINPKELKERVISVLSQKNAFTINTEAERERAEEGFSARYYSSAAQESLFQDLNAIDREIERIQGVDSISSKNKERDILNLIAVKTLMRESYVAAKINEDKTLSRTKVLENLFKSNPKEYTKTADVAFGTITLADGKKIQVISSPLEKQGQVNAENISKYLGEETLQGDNAHALVNMIERITGLGLGSKAKIGYSKPIQKDRGQLSSNDSTRKANKNTSSSVEIEKMETDSNGQHFTH